MSDALAALAASRPDLIAVESIGRTPQGRDIWLAAITNANAGGEKVAVLFDGAIHGSEVIGADSLLAYVRFLVEQYEVDDTARQIVDGWVTYVIPMLNPDGVEAGKDSTDWRAARKNANRVDLNRNFDWNWESGGSASPTSSTYRGPSPFSEAESQLVRDRIANLGALVYVNVHSGTDTAPHLVTPRGAPDDALYTSIARDVEELTGYRRTRGERGGQAMNWGYWLGLDPLREEGHVPLAFIVEMYTVDAIPPESPDWWFRYNPPVDEMAPWAERLKTALIYLTEISPTLRGSDRRSR